MAKDPITLIVGSVLGGAGVISTKKAYEYIRLKYVLGQATPVAYANMVNASDRLYYHHLKYEIHVYLVL